MQQCHNPLHFKDKYNSKISQTKHPQRNCKEMVIISWPMRSAYISSIIWSRNVYLREHPIFFIVVFYDYFPTVPDSPRFWIGFVLFTLQYYALCFIVHSSSFSPFFFCWSYIVCPSSVCAFWFPCLGLSNRPIVLYMMTSSFCFTQTGHTYVKRQYDIKQSIGNGIRIELSPTLQRSSPPAVTSHE